MRDNARGREIISQILDNMRSQTEELRYSRLVSSSYNVHLHPDDYARLENIVPEIVAQAQRALDEELRRLNQPSRLEERLRDWIRQPRVPYERMGESWSITILADANDELSPGDILVDATMVAADPERWAGTQTRRIVTHRHGDRVDRRVSIAEPEVARATAAAPAPATTPSAMAQAGNAVPEPSPAPVATAPALATLRWRDQSGEHAFRMVTPSIKVGRGGSTYWVDVKLDTVPDVSREHLRIRHDEVTRAFFIQDLSTFGTTVDGAPLPAPAAEAAAPEIPLPPRAAIGLAGVVILSFEAEA
jgi:hypothetical protein